MWLIPHDGGAAASEWSERGKLTAVHTGSVGAWLLWHGIGDERIEGGVSGAIRCVARAGGRGGRSVGALSARDWGRETASGGAVA